MSKNLNGKNIVDLPGILFGMIVQIQIEGLGMAHSRLIGVESGEYLIVKTPPIIDIATKLYEKNQIVVRYFSDGWVYAFRCTLLSLIKDPSRLSVLSFPECIDKINLRKHDRVDCNISFETIIEKQKYHGFVKDISAGGLSLEIDKNNNEEMPQLKINDVISLIMHREGNERSSIRGIVRNIRTDRTMIVIGMEFNSHGVELGENQNVNRWLENLISENP